MMVHGKKDDDINLNLAKMTKKLVEKANNCTTASYVRHQDDPTLNNYDETTSAGCTNGANVTLIAIDDVGHYPYLDCKGVCYVDGTETDTKIDTTALAWDFMKTHSSELAPDLSAASNASLAFVVALMTIASAWFVV